MKPVVYASICSCLNVRMCVYGFTREAARAPQIEIRSAVCKKRLSELHAELLLPVKIVSTAHATALLSLPGPCTRK